MPALDIFSGSAFSMVALTDAINKMPYVPGRIGQLGLFREQGVSTTAVMIEEREGSLTLVETTSRGAPAVQHVANKRKARSLTVPHIALEDTILADEVQNVRAFGSENMLEGVQAVLNQRLSEIDAPEEKSLRTLRYELDLTESTIAKLQGRIDELRKSPTLGFTTFIDTAQISALQSKIDELSHVRGQTQARIAFLEGPPEQSRAPGQTPSAPVDDTAGVKDRAERLQRIQEGLESTLFSITHEGSERIIAEHERRVAEIEALRAKDGSNAEQFDRLVEESAAVREAQLSQVRAKEAEAADKVRAANDRVVEGLNAERAALTSTERERFVAQALSRLSAEASAQQRREVEELAGALYDEQQALQARQRLMKEGRSVTDRTRTATEQYAAEIAKLDELLAAGAIDQQTYTRAVEEANERALRSSQAWTDGATRFLKDYVTESQDAATATERAFANAFSGAEDALVGFISTGKLEFQNSRRQHPCRPRAHDGAPDHHGPARRCSAERVRRRRPVRPLP